LAFKERDMKPINKFTETRLKKYLDEYRIKQNNAWRRYRSRGETDKHGAYREYLNAKSMMSNIRHKQTKGDWLYDDLPDGTRIGARRVIASGNPDHVGKLMDNFGRIINEDA
jgi:hypothetical protein